jgi:hypothetical protein
VAKAATPAAARRAAAGNVGGASPRTSAGRKVAAKRATR